jgi:hypothetical protein
MAEDQEFQKTLHVAFSPPASMIRFCRPGHWRLFYLAGILMVIDGVKTRLFCSG